MRDVLTSVRYCMFYILSSMQLLCMKPNAKCHCGFNTCMSDSEDRCHLFLRHHILTKSDMKAWRYRSHFFHVISMCVLISHKWHTSRCLVCVLSCCMTQALPTSHRFTLNMKYVLMDCDFVASHSIAILVLTGKLLTLKSCHVPGLVHAEINTG